jgi:hypothetical protein
VGASNGVYESLDRGDSITRVSTLRVNAFNGDPLVYGVVDNPSFILIGAGTGVHLRTEAEGAFTQVATLPATVVDVSVDVSAPESLFAITQTTVHYSSDGGAGFGLITGNLVSGFSPGRLRSMEFIPGTDNALVVAANRGVYVAYESSGFSQWTQLGSGLPNAVVFELEYDHNDRLLLAGTLGRGAWTLSFAGPDIFKDGFE